MPFFVKQNVTSEEDWATVVAKAEEAFRSSKRISKQRRY